MFIRKGSGIIMGSDTKVEAREVIINDFDSAETYVVRSDPTFSIRLLERLATLNGAPTESKLSPTQ